MTTGRSGAGRRRRTASDLAIGQIRGFYKLFCTWIYQALCSQLPLEVLIREDLNPTSRTPAWRRFIERLPKTREEAAIGLSSDLDAVLALISSGTPLKFTWLGPWSQLFRGCPEARALLAYAGLQLAEAFRKVKEPCPQEYLDKAIEIYHQDERSLDTDLLGQYPGALWPDSPSPAIQVGKVMIEYWLHGLSPSFKWGHFGPGAVSEKLDHIDRATCGPSWVPVYHTPVAEPPYFKSREEWRVWMLTHDPCEHPGTFPQAVSSRMVAVPKTATKPRLIAAEPAAVSWKQQSLLELLKRRMSKFPYLDITDQSHNQRLCLRGLATIDQSRASDRVSDALVQQLFPADWVRALDSVRTPSVKCLCGETHLLSKFAGMGAATTFPVETLIFAACALSRAYLEEGGSPWDDRHAVVSWLEGQQSMDVWGFYGDDAVVPNNMFEPACDEYQRWGFIPNEDKSYHGEDMFRESCGVMVTLDHNQWCEVSPARFHTWPDGSTGLSKSAPLVEVLNRVRLKIKLLSGYDADDDESRWTRIPRQAMLWDYSDMKGLLWSPKGFGWWDGNLWPVTADEYQLNWCEIDQRLPYGVVYRSTCKPDGEIPPSALYVCLSKVQQPTHMVDHDSSDQKTGEPVTVRVWKTPDAPTVLREPRPYKVLAVRGSRVDKLKKQKAQYLKYWVGC